MMDTSTDASQDVQVFVDDLSGEALNYAVESAKGHTLHPLNGMYPEGQWVAVHTLMGGEHFDAPIQNYAISSILAIDLVKDQRLDIESPKRHNTLWVVKYVSSKRQDQLVLYKAEHFELEVAVARCYVKSKRGEKIMIPLCILNRKGV